MFFVFFFKQKTAYEMRISDWSSDVCSSDLADQRLQRLEDGIDFLGYVVRPTHTLVRRRVISHAREALARWEQAHVRPGHIHATPAQLRAMQADRKSVV